MRRIFAGLAASLGTVVALTGCGTDEPLAGTAAIAVESTPSSTASTSPPPGKRIPGASAQIDMRGAQLEHALEERFSVPLDAVSFAACPWDDRRDNIVECLLHERDRNRWVTIKVSSPVNADLRYQVLPTTPAPAGAITQGALEKQIADEMTTIIGDADVWSDPLRVECPGPLGGDRSTRRTCLMFAGQGFSWITATVTSPSGSPVRYRIAPSEARPYA